jgi:hypothetical protein
MGNEIYKQHGFFSYMYMCVVDVVVHFVINKFGNNDTSQKNNVYKLFNFFICVHSIHKCILYP